MRQEMTHTPRKISPKYKHLISSYLCHVFDTMSDGIYITNKMGETLAVNSMYENLTGLDGSELIGVNVKDLVDTGVFDLALNAKVVQTKKSQTAVQRTGKGRKVILMAHPIFDYDEDVELVVTFVRDIALISQLKEQVASQRQLIEKYKNEINQKSDSLYLTPTSKPMLSLFSQIGRVAKTDATILFLGETGVGKDVMAREVHEQSQRKAEPFFKVDCTCIPENLIESELFGYAPGAFSGADSRGKLGLFEMADKGTLFLDEIGELPLAMQSKLLRVLQNGEIQRVGATKAKKINVRVIAATNRDLEQEVQEGNFRSDLFYRLQVAVMQIPSLRERGEDLPAMIQFFIKQFNNRYKRTLRLSAKAEEVMINYAWPGNIRELENLVHSLAVTCENSLIDLRHLPSSMLENSTAVGLSDKMDFASISEGKQSLKEIMAEIEGKYLEYAVEKHGSIAAAAKALGVNRTTIFRKMKKAEG